MVADNLVLQDSKKGGKRVREEGDGCSCMHEAEARGMDNAG
jgi:hypothetical protein